MIIVRDVYQVKFGKVDALLDIFSDARRGWAQNYNYRVLTDASGPFYTVVAELEVASLAEWEQRLSALYANAEFGQWFTRIEPLIESGRREFYKVEKI